jgi:hypothetical protein
VIRKRIHKDDDGVQLDADVNAVVALNVGEEGSSSHVSSHQRIVQRSGPGTKKKRSDGEEVNQDG